MIPYKKVEKQDNNLKNVEYIDVARLFKTSFVRNRKMNLTKMIAFIL